MWHNVWAVIRREYLQRVRSKWFIIVTLAAPILMIGMIVVPAFITARGDQADRNILVVDGSNVLYERLVSDLEAGGYTVAEERWTVDVITDLRRQASDGDIGGFLVLDELTLETGEAVMYTNDRPSTIRRVMLRSAIVRAALEYRLEEQGLDAGAMLAGGELRVEMLVEDGSDMDDPQFLVAYMGTLFLYMVILIYAVSVMRATLEEKTTRMVEVIISSMKPWHLMLGKIVGVGAVSLTQMAVWLCMGVLVVGAGVPMLIAARPELASLENVVQVLPGLALLLLFVGFFLFGFFMYSGLYAAVGAMCSTEEEAQQAQFPVMMFLIVPILFVMQAIQDPLAPLVTGLSLFPLFTPVLMWARVAGGGVPGWQVGLSFVLMGATVFGVAWVAGRIYKVGILMAGKRPSLPELWRWVREA
ncbi:MAG: ABC transporter permease [Gemmatimonadetes bacterium]|nr:ABC transporter permease [Gemmatimonadota bacterium]